jgi:hypothetical protein
VHRACEDLASCNLSTPCLRVPMPYLCNTESLHEIATLPICRLLSRSVHLHVSRVLRRSPRAQQHNGASSDDGRSNENALRHTQSR